MIQLNILKKFSSAFSINILAYSDSGLIAAFGSHVFSPNLAAMYMQPYIHTGRAISYLVTKDSLFCGYLEYAGSDEYLIIGPAASFELNATNANHILEELSIDPSKKPDLLVSFHQYPIMSITSFRDMLDLLNTILNPDRTDELIHITQKTTQVSVTDSKDLSFDPHSPFETEQRLGAMIMHGRTEELTEYLSTMNTTAGLTVPNLGPSVIRSLKNTLISACSATTRYAIAGGLSYEAALSLSDYYIAKVESLTVAQDILSLLSVMQIDFCSRVSNCSRKDDAPATLILIYRDIQEHLHQKISSRDIALRLHMERTYLCHYFKKETGQTLTQYIHQQKINEACYLIETSDLSFVEISEKMGFSSQQQFSKVFKETLSLTPGEYKALRGYQTSK